MMDTWIELARGPLFRISLTVMVLGLAYRIGVVIVQIVASWRRAADHRFPWNAVVSATVGWLLPRRLFRAKPLYSAASFLFHVGIIVVPLFLAGHIHLLGAYLPAGWPALPAIWSDTLTLIALVAMLGLIVGRVATATARALSKPQDVAIMTVLFLMVLFGFFASHPAWSPFQARTAVLVHMLLGNLILILIPTTKIVHCALYPFTQLIFALGWHFPAETGTHVAAALAKENEPV